jgi:uncharacterized membrane protein YphA (DoxX/SURF4 family)
MGLARLGAVTEVMSALLTMSRLGTRGNAFVFVRFNHVASLIVNANHSIISTRLDRRSGRKTPVQHEDFVTSCSLLAS